MILQPHLLRIRIHNKDTRSSLWLPLFLIWPLILLVMVILSPLVLIDAVLLWPMGLAKPILLAGPSLFRLFCSIKGLEVAMGNSSEQVLISIR